MREDKEIVKTIKVDKEEIGDIEGLTFLPIIDKLKKTEVLKKKETELEKLKQRLKLVLDSDSIDIRNVERSGEIFGFLNTEVSKKVLNERLREIRGNFIKTNSNVRKVYNLFNGVYDAFEALNREYILAIQGSVQKVRELAESTAQEFLEQKEIMTNSVIKLNKLAERNDQELLEHKEKMITAFEQINKLEKNQNYLLDEIEGIKSQKSVIPAAVKRYPFVYYFFLIFVLANFIFIYWEIYGK